MTKFFEDKLRVKKRDHRRGFLFILSSPSGVGKSTLSRLLLKDGQLELSISMTTRQRRLSEVDGLHYHFISKKSLNASVMVMNLLNGQKFMEIITELYGKALKTY